MGVSFCYFDDRNLVMGGPSQGTRETVATGRANIMDKINKYKYVSINMCSNAACARSSPSGAFFASSHLNSFDSEAGASSLLCNLRTL